MRITTSDVTEPSAIAFPNDTSCSMYLAMHESWLLLPSKPVPASNSQTSA
ncbi:MAG TPA: hypothetical protein VKU39_07565 [Streptosporangiaceae bacterium]|nr:hypothetical protein [Streptosporangiaceae bacterium]